MFKDQVTGKNSKSGEKTIKIVVETRTKQYYEMERDKMTGELRATEKMQGVGQEAVKELTVTEETAKLISLGKLKLQKATK